jgi:hypothetical protein
LSINYDKYDDENNGKYARLRKVINDDKNDGRTIESGFE